MLDARDAEDNRLLENGEHKQLVANYFDYVRVLARARANNAYDADEIASMVFVRLLRWLDGRLHTRWPFRVIVRRSVGFIALDYYRGLARDAELPEDWDPEAPSPQDEWEEWTDLTALFADLPPRPREVATLLYLGGLSHDQIAEQLEIERNAVDQALWRAHRKLEELVDGP